MDSSRWPFTGFSPLLDEFVHLAKSALHPGERALEDGDEQALEALRLFKHRGATVLTQLKVVVHVKDAPYEDVADPAEGLALLKLDDR